MRPTLLAVALIIVMPAASPAQEFLGKKTNQWLDLLKTGTDAQRRNAAFALGKIGSPAAPAVPALKKAVREDASPKVRESAALALGEIGGTSLQVARDEDLVEALKDALKNPSELVRRSAACALGNLGSDGLAGQQALGEALQDGNAGVRQNAAWALGKLGPTSVKYLQLALADADRFVQRDAANALASMEGEKIRPVLSELCKLCAVEDSEVRRAALAALIKTVGDKDQAAGESILKALTDKDLEVRRNAAFTLCNIGGKTALPALPILKDALRKGDEPVRRLAAAGIFRLGPEAISLLDDLVGSLRDTDPRTRAYCALAIGGLGSGAAPAVPNLVKMIADEREDKEARMIAGAALQAIGNVPAAAEAVPELLKVLENPKQDSKVREKVTWALRVHQTKLGTLKGVVPAFTTVLKEGKGNGENKMLRYDCAYLLGFLLKDSVPNEALETLHEFLQDTTIEIYDKVEVTVTSTGTEVKGGVAEVKNRGKGDGRKMAMDSLKEIGAARVKAHPQLIEQIRTLSRSADASFDAKLRDRCKKFLTDNGL